MTGVRGPDPTPAVAVPSAGARATGRTIDALDRRLTIAAILATGVVGVSVLIRVLAPAIVPAATIPGVVALARLLVAVGALCLAALMVRRAPAIAWLSLSVAAVIAVRDPAVLAGELEGAPSGSGYLSAAAVVSVVATAATLVAVLYATRPERPTFPWSAPVSWAILGWVVIACSGSLILTAAGARASDDLTPWDFVNWPVQAWPVVLLPLLALGAAGDLLPAARAASRRAGVGRGRAAARPGASASPGATVSWGAAFVDELLGREARRRAAVDAERRRLATDLHAEVLPQLRSVLREAEAGRAGPFLAAALRAIADELEEVMSERRDPVLEALGLVAALETQAERSEERGSPPIELRILEADEDGRAPASIEAAALRIARLALDNAARHAGAGRIVISVATGPGHVHLSVEDDGRGIEPEDLDRARTTGRRGIVDMGLAAGEVGGTLRVSPAEGPGTAVAFDWPG